jgi:hypothetical protein
VQLPARRSAIGTLRIALVAVGHSSRSARSRRRAEYRVGQGRQGPLPAVARQEFQGKRRWYATHGAAIDYWFMRARTPNQSLKRSANGVAHWLPSAGPAAHFALAIQRATPLAYRLALR